MILKIEPRTRDAYNLFHDGVLTLADLEQNGIRIDMDYCRKQATFMRTRMKKLQTRVSSTMLWKKWKHRFGARASITATQQLAAVISKDMRIRIEKQTESGADSADEETLSSVKVKGIKDVVRYRKLHKAVGTYLDGIVRETVDGFLHPSFDLHTVISYRSSSSNPNFQNIPVRNPEIAKIIRRAFIPRPGRRIVENDFKGIEVSVAYCYHQDPVMREYLVDPTKDMHRDMAMQCYMVSQKQITKDIRYYGKNQFVFPQFYGSYYVDCAAGLWKHMLKMHLALADGTPLKDHLTKRGIKRYAQFEDHLREVEEDFWGRRFMVYDEWRKRWYERYCRRGYLHSLTGFTCSGLMRRNQVINVPVQGSAFHCLLWCLIKINKHLRLRRMKTLLIGQIHDSIIADVPEDETDEYLHLVRYVCSDLLPRKWTWITVPMVVEAEVTPVNGSWYEKKEVEFPKG